MPVGTAFHERTFRSAKASTTASGRDITRSASTKCITSMSTTPFATPRRSDRHLAALQVFDHRPRRDPPGEPRDHARHQQGHRGPGHLLLLVRRSRGRSSTMAHSRVSTKTYIAGRPPTPACVGSARTAEHGGRDRRHFREGCRSCVARPDFGAIAKVRGGSRHCQPEILPRHARQNRRRARRHFAHWIHRRPGLRNLDALERRGESLGRGGGKREGSFDIHAAGMLALDVARVEARCC